MKTSLNALVRRRIKDYLASLPSRPTQQAIGDALGRTQTWVSHYLSGRHDIDLDTLSKFAAFLRVDIRSLIDEEGEIRHTVPDDFAEALTLLEALSPEERDTAIGLLRFVVRRPMGKRARKP